MAVAYVAPVRSHLFRHLMDKQVEAALADAEWLYREWCALWGEESARLRQWRIDFANTYALDVDDFEGGWRELVDDLETEMEARA